MTRKNRKRYAVWIYDKDSGFDSPMICLAANITEARQLGREYIRKWNLDGGEIVKVEILDGGEARDKQVNKKNHPIFNKKKTRDQEI